jgi:C4-dicarboxylate-specific signal transduction histidine kinase
MIELERMNDRLQHEIQDRIQAERRAADSQAQVINSSKMAALGEMAGGIAHEVNTPLATIHTTAGQLQELIMDEPLDRGLVAKMIATVVTTAERIAKIILSMKSFSRDSTRDPLVSESLQQIIDSTTVLCVEKFKANGVKLDAPALPPEFQIYCRANEISQVLLNLLNNARDAVEQLDPDKKWVKIDVSENQDAVELSVTDGGSGIPAESRSRLFQPFFTTKEVGRGTGLGLSISKRIAESHGGDLHVDSSSPNTRFVLKIKKRSGDSR